MWKLRIKKIEDAYASNGMNLRNVYIISSCFSLFNEAYTQKKRKIPLQDFGLFLNYCFFLLVVILLSWYWWNRMIPYTTDWISGWWSQIQSFLLPLVDFFVHLCDVFSLVCFLKTYSISYSAFPFLRVFFLWMIFL